MPDLLCPCCRKTYPTGAHSQIECAKSYLGRVLPFLGDLSAEEIGKLHHLRGFPKASIVRIIPSVEEKISVTLTQGGGTQTAYQIKGSEIVTKTPDLPDDDRVEHEAWIKMIAQRKQAVNSIRGRV
jgi:hypothetical protein